MMPNDRAPVSLMNLLRHRGWPCWAVLVLALGVVGPVRAADDAPPPSEKKAPPATEPAKPLPPKDTVADLAKRAAVAKAEDPPKVDDAATKAALEDIKHEADAKHAARKDQKKLRQKASHLNHSTEELLGLTRTIAPGKHHEAVGNMLNQFRAPVGMPMPMPMQGGFPNPMMGQPGGVWGGMPGQPQFQNFQGPNGGGFFMRW